MAKKPLLLIVFNRYNSTKKVLEKIREYQPQKLYVAADGPRSNVEDDAMKCKAVRELIGKIDWQCDLKLLLRDVNVGCKAGVSSAISWFFENEEDGIILEDDCLPGTSFFIFCEELLQRFKNDCRVMHIGGTNLQFGRTRGDASYYFSSIASVWGWAGWRRTWKNYDLKMSTFKDFETMDLMRFVFPDLRVATWATETARACYEGKIPTWDFQYAYSVIINNGLCITPNKNLVSNIGFADDGSHTTNSNDPHANIPIEEMGEIRHPQFFIPNRQADLFQLSLSIPKTFMAEPEPTPLRKLANKVARSFRRNQALEKD